MLLEAMLHRPKFNWAYAYDQNTLHLRLRVKKGDAAAVTAITGDKYSWEETKAEAPMRLLSSDELFDYWETAVVPPYRRLRYAFRLTGHGGESVVMTEKGFFDKVPDNPHKDFFDFPFLNPADVFAPPEWVKDAVFYQIFPERFANGDPDNDPEGVLPWGGKPTPTNFFGGDLQGVIDHLDHLERLGVNAIYFTPLFEATTNHKYDTEDYLRVDRHFGTNEKLKELVDACHARGIRVMLDAVFNHAGSTFGPFVDVAEKGPDSPYADWFHVREWPIAVRDGIPTYDAFAFGANMPKLNTENPEVQRYLLKVARYWIEEIGIDGWRLDVANEVDHRFWRKFRDTVKAAKPDAYILGEIWHDSLPWLQGDQFDAVMNYPFTEAVLDFFARGVTEAETFSAKIGAQLAAYPQQVTETAFNLLDSHDTPRLLTECGGNEAALRLALLFQLTYPGVPCIYYGDEVGMSGLGDPDCRGCMVWEEEKQNAELFRFYREAIALRRSHPSLRGAGFRFLYAKGSVIVYERSKDGERIVIALNAGGQAAEAAVRLPLGGGAGAEAGASVTAASAGGAAPGGAAASGTAGAAGSSGTDANGAADPSTDAAASAAANPFKQVALASSASAVSTLAFAPDAVWRSLLDDSSVEIKGGLLQLQLPAYGYRVWSVQ
ncbi:glycoside hydrolase family 13 protein [Paenibacillus thailandensis]|uniref:Glycoside hydrolase family 13 protein n=1 Tax=Paenibacillus thailandensis TaxID=393250 RepID=A0ABW5R0F0_9BACL